MKKFLERHTNEGENAVFSPSEPVQRKTSHILGEDVKGYKQYL